MPQSEPDYVLLNNYQQHDVLEVVVEGVNEGMPWALVRHYLVQTAVSTTAIQDLLKNRWEDEILPDMADELTDKWTAECITVRRAAPGPGPVKFYSLTAIPGVIATDGTPNGSALVMRFNTGTAGARGRGRMYIPGLPEASTNGGLLLASKQAAWDAIAALIVADVTGGGNDLAPCVLSRAAFNDLPNPFLEVEYTGAITLIAPEMTDANIVGNLGSQRDRRYKRGVFGA